MSSSPEYERTPKRREYKKRYGKLPHVQERRRAYNKSPERRAWAAKLRATPGFKEKQSAYAFKWMLKRKYGITVDQYNAMLKAQGGVCAICGKTKEQNGARLAVDHCHDTGIVRGILCIRCNVTLGVLGEDPVLIFKMFNYATTQAARKKLLKAKPDTMTPEQWQAAVDLVVQQSEELC